MQGGLRSTVENSGQKEEEGNVVLRPGQRHPSYEPIPVNCNFNWPNLRFCCWVKCRPKLKFSNLVLLMRRRVFDTVSAVLGLYSRLRQQWRSTLPIEIQNAELRHQAHGLRPEPENDWVFVRRTACMSHKRIKRLLTYKHLQSVV